MRSWSQLSRAGVFAAVVSTYVVAGLIAWAMQESSNLGTLLSPSIGVAAIALISWPRSQWPQVIAGILAGELLLEALLERHDQVVPALGIMAGRAAGPAIGALMLAQLLGTARGEPIRPDLGRLRQLVAVGFSLAVIGPTLTATSDALAVWSDSDTLFVDLWVDAWLALALGIVVVVPICLVWSASSGPRIRARLPAAIVVACFALATIVTHLATDLPLLWLVLVGLVVVAALFDARTVALAAVAISIVTGVVLSVDPEGLIGGLGMETALRVTQIEQLVFLAIAYAIGAEVTERSLATERSLRQTATVSELQRLLLPPAALSGDGFRAVGIYDAAASETGVGGDWYLIRRIPDGRIVIGVGDIVGHDLDAARTMAAVRSGLVLEAAVDPTPHRLLERLDAYSEVEPSIRYGSAWLGWYDPATHRFEYACAGHLPPLLATPGGVERLDDANSALIGLPRGERWSASIEVPPGSSLVLYTDGLVERRDDTIDTGIDRLSLALLDRHLDPRSVADDLLADSRQEDDSILVLVELGDAAPATEVVARRRHTSR